MRCLYSSQPTSRCSGFTLLELILAILLASGLLLGVLSFYQQSARLRGELQTSVEELSRVRLLFETLARELPAATVTPDVASLRLRGGADWIEFAAPASAMPPSEFNEHAARADFLLVRYGPNASASALETGSTSEFVAVSSSVRFSGETSEPQGESLQESDETSGGGVGRVERRVFGQRVSERPLNVPILDEGQLRFRYFAHSVWSSEWNGPGLPLGVEVSVELSSSPLSEEKTTSEPLTSTQSEDVFRRVVYLPAAELTSVASAVSASSMQEVVR